RWACAAGRACAAHRRTHAVRSRRSGRTSPHRSVPARATTARLERWSDGRNLRIEYRWSGGNADDARKYAAELVALSPDVIFADGNSTLAPLLQITRTVPIVFAVVADPVGAGFVNSLARPGGNATGFVPYEYGIAAKW